MSFLIAIFLIFGLVSYYEKKNKSKGNSSTKYQQNYRHIQAPTLDELKHHYQRMLNLNSDEQDDTYMQHAQIINEEEREFNDQNVQLQNPEIQEYDEIDQEYEAYFNSVQNENYTVQSKKQTKTEQMANMVWSSTGDKMRVNVVQFNEKQHSALRQGVIWAEILKRPKFGVLPKDR